MARIRTIKPDFFKSATIASLTYPARLTFIGLWCLADDEGRLRYDARVVAGELWPQEDDVSWDNVVGHVAELSRASLVEVYDVGPTRYLWICTWAEHQKINRPTPSKNPPPPGAAGMTQRAVTDDSVSPPALHVPISEGGMSALLNRPHVDNSLQELSLAEGEGEREMEGEGEGPPPPRKCPLHAHTREYVRCGACKDARLERADWDAAQERRKTASPRQEEECPIHPGYPHPSSAYGCVRCGVETS